jgi:hypothetical protein
VEWVETRIFIEAAVLIGVKVGAEETTAAPAPDLFCGYGIFLCDFVMG